MSAPDASPDAAWERLKTLVADAAALPPEAHAAFLDAACPDDADLRADAAALLAADADTALGAFDRMSTGVRALAEAAVDAPPDAAPDVSGLLVGPYRLVREVGRGGMGTVFLAERADGQYDQRVALKLIRTGAASQEAQRRFRQERQTLARLEHVGIARLLDGGVTPPAPDAPDGLPFLVMEFVDGETITAASAGRSVEARLGLLLQVCDAVAYAHRHLVVHRDLKPANVLVTDAGDGPQVKLLDFGIARLLDDDADDATRTGMRMLTPAYAAPEQLAGAPATTATDVYALGVLAHEVLVGTGPDAAPTRPSTVAARAGDAARARRLRGDLDTVVLKALRAEPERRYASAAELADDLRRHLAHEPVRARPDTVRYRAGRFVRRHRAGVAAAVLVAAAVVGGAGVALRQARVAEAAEARSAATLAFFQATLYAAGPGGARPDGTLRDGLDSAAAHVDRDLAGQPLVAAAVHSTVGLSYYTLGDYRAAEAQQRMALAGYRRAGRAERLNAAVEMQNLGVTLDSDGRSEEALPLLRASLPVQARLGTPYQHGSALNALAIALDATGRRDEAETNYRAAIALWREARADELPLALNNLAILYEGTRRTAAAVPLVEEAAAVLRAQGATAEPRLGPVLATLGSLYDYSGRPDAAALALDSALVVMRRALGPDHPLTLQSTASRALVDVRRGRPAAAIPLARRALAGVRRTLPADHPITPHAAVILAEALCAVDSARAGEVLAREALRTRRELYPADHALVAVTESVEGACLARLGRGPEARRLLAHGLAVLRADRGDADARTGDARRRLAAASR